MGFLKQLLATVFGGLIVAMILRHMDFIEMWIVNRIWVIVLYAISIVIGAVIGLLIIRKSDFFIRIFLIVCRWIFGVFKWLFGKFQNVITTISGSGKKNANIEKEIKGVNERITNLENGLKEEIKKQFESVNESFKLNMDNIFKEIAHGYFVEAMKALADINTEVSADNTMNNLEYHFMRLSSYYQILTINKIKLSDWNFYYYERTYQFIYKYKEITTTKFPHLVEFLRSFSKFKNYCKEEERHFIKVSEIWKELCNRFGDDNVYKAVNFGYV